MFNDASAYDSYMGRYSRQLAPQMADFAGVEAGQRVLDVGAGTGLLTAELVRRVGAGNVVAAEPSDAFVEALRSRYPGVAVERAAAESLPFEDGEFDAAIAQLVVHFMADPIAGISEIRRVTRAGGVVAACVWDAPMSRSSPLSLFWEAAHLVDPGAATAEDRPGMREGDLGHMFTSAGFRDVAQTELWIHVRHETFEQWWTPYEDGTGPAGRYIASLDSEQRAKLREAARGLVAEMPIEINGRAWAARGVVPG